MTRRGFLAALVATTLCPLSAFAQQARVRRIGLLMAYREGDPEGQDRVAAFRDGLREAGWTEGQNAFLELRWLAGDPARAKAVVQELVTLEPDVIVVNGSPGLTAVREATTSIPVVFVVVADPVGAGFIQSLSRPGGNITGFSTFDPEIGGKWLEVLKEIAPNLRRVGVLTDPGFRGFSSLWLAIHRLAPSFSVEAVAIHAREGAEIVKGIESFAQQQDGGLIVLPTPINSVRRDDIVSVTMKHRLPAIYPFAFHARSGGLIAYGFDAADLFRRAGPYVARVLKGEKSSPCRHPQSLSLSSI